jgi:hypothetical protein
MLVDIAYVVVVISLGVVHNSCGAIHHESHRRKVEKVVDRLSLWMLPKNLILGLHPSSAHMNRDGNDKEQHNSEVTRRGCHVLVDKMRVPPYAAF